MNEVEMKTELATRNALLTTFHQCGMKPLADSETAILAKLKELGVSAEASAGYLSLTTLDGTAIVPSAACERIRKECPHLFVADPRRDAVSSRADLERGTPQEVSQAKAQFITKNGLAAYEALPKTRAEAERRAVTPSADLTRSEYLSLSFSDKSRLAGVLGSAGIGRIMSRRG